MQRPVGFCPFDGSLTLSRNQYEVLVTYSHPVSGAKVEAWRKWSQRGFHSRQLRSSRKNRFHGNDLQKCKTCFQKIPPNSRQSLLIWWRGSFPQLLPRRLQRTEVASCCRRRRVFEASVQVRGSKQRIVWFAEKKLVEIRVLDAYLFLP